MKIKALRHKIRRLINRVGITIKFKLLKPGYLKLGKDVYLASPLQSAVHCPTTIGDYSRINGAFRFRGQGKIVIGKYAAIGDDLKIIVSNHDIHHANLQVDFQEKYGFEDLFTTKGDVVIGHNVWIGDSVTILSGVQIGDGAVIASGAVVTRNIPSFSVAAGVPARVVKPRFSPAIESQLVQIPWWDWPEEKIIRNRDFFSRDFTANPELDLSSIIK